jgi:spore coat protein U-like protein
VAQLSAVAAAAVAAAAVVAAAVAAVALEVCLNSGDHCSCQHKHTISFSKANATTDEREQIV